MTRPSVLLADDHQVLLDALSNLLEPRCDVIGRVSDGPSLVDKARALKPDIVVTDIAMPGGSGLDAAETLLRDVPGLRIIFLTMNEDPDIAVAALRMGASGYVLKSAAANELFHAIEAAQDGRAFVSPSLVGETLPRLIQHPASPSDTEKPESVRLTPRQKEVLRLVAKGLSMKDTARVLHITTRTVAFHKYNIMKMLELETTAELIRYVLENDEILE